MLNQTFEPIIDHSWVPSSAWRSLHLSERNKRREKLLPDLLDHVPVMSSTVLGLEVLLDELSIDLRMASELVLSDVGATIQVLRLIGKEYDVASERPYRMGDCLASLDVDDWFRAISTSPFICDGEHAPLTALWNHCYLVAQYSQLVAESLGDISPEDAYLVGLLHGIGKIPAVLGWPYSSAGGNERAPLSTMEGTMPLFVVAALRSVNDNSDSPWKFILKTAHELAGTPIEVPLACSNDLGSTAVRSRLPQAVSLEDCLSAGIDRTA